MDKLNRGGLSRIAIACSILCFSFGIIYVLLTPEKKEPKLVSGCSLDPAGADREYRKRIDGKQDPVASSIHIHGAHDEIEPYTR
jgi:hypothetical protein